MILIIEPAFPKRIEAEVRVGEELLDSQVNGFLVGNHVNKMFIIIADY